jgi:hypothetical protein
MFKLDTGVKGVIRMASACRIIRDMLRPRLSRAFEGRQVVSEIAHIVLIVHILGLLDFSTAMTLERFIGLDWIRGRGCDPSRAERGGQVPKKRLPGLGLTAASAASSQLNLPDP